VTQLPPSLVRFEAQLEDAIRAHSRRQSERPFTTDREHSRPTTRSIRRRRRTALRVAAVFAGVAAGVGAFAVWSSDQPPASAIDQAEAVLAPSDGSIVHVVHVTTNTRPDGTTEQSRSETWQQTVAPYNQREVSFGSDGSRGREIGQTNGQLEVWNPLTNTLSTTASPTPLSQAGFDLGIGPRLLENMRNLLASGKAREAGPASVGGRSGIRIVADEGHSLVVDAQTYEPIQWTITSDDGIKSTTVIERYETLPASQENLAAVSVSAQHPDAPVDRNITFSNEAGAEPKR
jgi:hypothetical protein